MVIGTQPFRANIQTVRRAIEKIRINIPNPIVTKTVKLTALAVPLSNNCSSMKIIFRFLSVVFIAFGLAASIQAFQKQPPAATLTPGCYVSCFNTQVTEQFRTHDVTAEFAQWHPTPTALVLENTTGKTITYATPSGTTAQGYYIEAQKKSNNYIFVIQEWWGLNNHIKNEAEKLAKEFPNTHILAIDMYDGKVAATRDSAMVYMRAATSDRLQEIVKGAIGFAGAKANIYTIGWCFGGMWSLQTALLAGKQAKGCIMYYGRPENDLAKLQQLNCDVIGFFGANDQMPNTTVVKQFQENMATAGKQLVAHSYPAGHGFANPSNPNFNKEATEDAYAKTLAYLREKLAAK